MDKSVCTKESGQILIILTVGIVVLLAFTALAVDTGMYYSDRRYDQNAADASAFAGAGAAATYINEHDISYSSFNCSDSKVLNAIQAAKTAAIQLAASNNFVIDNNLVNQHGVEVFCEDVGGETGRYLDIKVMISSDVKTSFAQLVYKGKFHNTVEAVTQVVPGTNGPFADGYAILALKESCDKVNCSSGDNGGITDCGNVDIDVVVGGMYSNACLSKAGNSGTIHAEDGIYYITTLDDKHNKFDPTPEKVTTPILLQVKPPDCGAVPEESAPKKGGTIYPGQYHDITLTGNGDLVMMPGLYCVSGSFQVNNGTLSIDGGDDEGVTIYLTGTDSSFDTTGNVQVNLRAPRGEPEEVSPAIPGMLIMMAEGNHNEIDFGGTSGSYYRGTIYAPTGVIDMGGNSGLAGSQSTQIIGSTIRVHGNPGLVVNFDAGDIYEDTAPTLLDLYK